MIGKRGVLRRYLIGETVGSSQAKVYTLAWLADEGRPQSNRKAVAYESGVREYRVVTVSVS